MWREFTSRADGLAHAMSGGLWLHRHRWYGHDMAHVVSADRHLLIAFGLAEGLNPSRLQFKPLRDPRDRIRRDAWHWDLVGPWVPHR